MSKAIITITTADGEETNIEAVFDPPCERDTVTLAEHLACVAIKAMIADTKRLIADRDEPDSTAHSPNSTSEDAG